MVAIGMEATVIAVIKLLLRVQKHNAPNNLDAAGMDQIATALLFKEQRISPLFRKF